MKSRWYPYGVFFALFIAYLVFQSRAFLFAPPLLLPYSSSTLTVAESAITIQGSTSPQAELFVNDEEVSVALDGHFSFPLSLPKGISTVIIKARNPFGRERVRTLIVIVK